MTHIHPSTKYNFKPLPAPAARGGTLPHRRTPFPPGGKQSPPIVSAVALVDEVADRSLFRRCQFCGIRPLGLKGVAGQMSGLLADQPEAKGACSGSVAHAETINGDDDWSSTCDCWPREENDLTTSRIPPFDPEVES